ncbi:MAG: threonine/serine dehydratase [Acidobacteriota bacterium]|nr:MAG: threonine/serine dehydratase [Acidobacteriota bacterium]
MRDAEIVAEVQAAEATIRPYVRETPLEHSPFLSELGGADVYLKLENQQLTGSFKLRGAINKILSLSSEERARPVVTASSGNHAAAVAYTLDGFGGEGIIYLPESVAKAKVDALSPYGVELRFVGQDCVVGELEAKKTAAEEGWTYVSPYSDAKILGGQGTIALEIERQGDPIDTILVPVGGGGLIAGIAGYLKARDASIRVIGCQPENSRVMAESVKAGKILELDTEPTLADGVAGGLDPDAITFPICQRVVDEFALLGEDAIAEAMRFMIEKHHMLIEGAAALSIAAYLEDPTRHRDQTVVLVVSGKKVSLETLTKVLSK